MDKIGRWKLSEALTVYQTALLLAEHDPSAYEMEPPAEWPREIVQDIAPFLNAIKSAVVEGRIEFTQRSYTLTYGQNEIDWFSSLIQVDSLKNWLSDRDYTDGFFSQREKTTDILEEKRSNFYAPKLAAAVRAWKEVTSDPAALIATTPKKALEIWLRKHANEYGLTRPDGKPNELGIEEVCKVANWKPAGGASKTPEKPMAALPSPLSNATGGGPALNPPIPNRRTSYPSSNYRPPSPDDDIPF